MEEGSKKSRRGFASMTPERRREIARMGGKAAHVNGTAHQFTPEEAREAGKKGGKSVSANRDHMATIGKKGGQARGISPNRFGITKEEEQQDGTDQ